MKRTIALRARLILLLLVLAFGTLVLAGCGSGSPGRYGAPPPAQPTTIPPTDVPGY